MAHHEIEVRLQNGRAIPVNIPESMKRFDTVEYFSPDGRVRVEFDDPVTSAGAAVGDRQTVTLLTPGVVFCKCFIEVGWTAQKPESGGVHDIRP